MKAQDDTSKRYALYTVADSVGAARLSLSIGQLLGGWLCTRHATNKHATNKPTTNKHATNKPAILKATTTLCFTPNTHFPN